jgi:hypothetical protein
LIDPAEFAWPGEEQIAASLLGFASGVVKNGLGEVGFEAFGVIDKGFQAGFGIR